MCPFRMAAIVFNFCLSNIKQLSILNLNDFAGTFNLHKENHGENKALHIIIIFLCWCFV